MSGGDERARGTSPRARGRRCRSQRDAAVCFNGLLARLAARCASLPDSRVLFGVHDRNDVDQSRIQAVENGVGEALDKLSAQIIGR
jgi:hypothetical protein